jgi:psiF repeat
MRLLRVVALWALAATAGIGISFGQTPATTAPAAKPAVAAKQTGADKAAISKACSEQADAKGLHGKERKKFRSECKRKGGKAS